MLRLINSTRTPQLLEARGDLFGYLMTPRRWGTRRKHLEACRVFGMDNDRFNPGWSEAKFRRMLAECQPWREKCAFCLAPDVVADREATLREFALWREEIAAYGYPVAIAGQDRMVPADIPWGEIDALFVGGSTDWRLSQEAAALIRAARKRGKWVHVGRVNSFQRALHFAKLGVDSIDGTDETFRPDRYLTRWIRWLAELNAQMHLPL